MPAKKVKGGKAKKLKGGKAANRGAGNKRNNPRAFLSAAGPVSMRNNAYRALEKQEKQYHVQLTDRSVEAAVPPPFVVAVIGPPGVGKSTLIKSLVKQWTKMNLGEVAGPVTVVTGKKRRITIIECPNDMNAMCDVSKVADLALLLVDGTYGFQMETFEFLNMCQVRVCAHLVACTAHARAKQRATAPRARSRRIATNLRRGSLPSPEASQAEVCWCSSRRCTASRA